MNSASFKSAKKFIELVSWRPRFLALAAFLLSLLVTMPSVRAWEIDLSRRQVDFDRVRNDNRLPASRQETAPAGLLERALENVEPAQDIVILNTDKGFVPDAVRFRKGATYRVHVVNVNASEKNVSFVFDAFSESHATFYGQVKTFTVTPKIDGVFTFQCPETAWQGRAVVIGDERKPAAVQ